MGFNLRGQSFLSLKSLSSEEIQYLLNLSLNLKDKKRSGIQGNTLSGKNIVLIFQKSSTRTRCAFEVAAYDEGANVTFLNNSQMETKESIEDTARVLGRLYDGIEFRGFEQQTVECLAKHAGVPVWNGLTNKYHPTQIIADFMTLIEHTHKKLDDTKLVFVGDTRSNMGNSLMIGAAKMGMHFVALAPSKLFPDKQLITEMQSLAKQTGGRIELTESIDTAVLHADAIYTDVWFSMGEEDKTAERIQLLRNYQVTMDMLAKTKNPHVLFMHCLPACHNTDTHMGQIATEYGLNSLEVTDEVFNSRNSIVFDQAENRLHSIKAVMVATIGNT
ncbi:ornithine carbamoyltransferase [uncultured Shewanella sp.]|uniref:ornithine carbamoyltransferase n=1 Tax=uncultured Shewanella sp. TaxID=173975 RepID=UPI0026369A0F|nr:ornithine carbamoyltransferase [uncultured Shewanella sp.]